MRIYYLQTVALLELSDKLFGGKVAANGGEKALDELIWAVNIQKTTDDGWETGWIDLLHVDLDVLLLIVLEQVHDKVANEVEAIADNDEWELVGQLDLLEEVLDNLRIVVLALTADALDFADLANLASSLDVLEVDLWILAVVDNRTEEGVETFVALEGLEQLRQGSSRQLLVVLGGNLK